MFVGFEKLPPASLSCAVKMLPELKLPFATVNGTLTAAGGQNGEPEIVPTVKVGGAQAIVKLLVFGEPLTAGAVPTTRIR